MTEDTVIIDARDHDGHEGEDSDGSGHRRRWILGALAGAGATGIAGVVGNWVSSEDGFKDPAIESVANNTEKQLNANLKGDAVYPHAEDIVEVETNYLSRNKAERIDNRDLSPLVADSRYAVLDFELDLSGGYQDIDGYFGQNLEDIFIEGVSDEFVHVLDSLDRNGAGHFYSDEGTDENDTQIVGANVTLNGENGSLAERYFGDNEVKHYASDQAGAEELAKTMKSEVSQEGGFHVETGTSGWF
jgi:hypothetical protein